MNSYYHPKMRRECPNEYQASDFDFYCTQHLLCGMACVSTKQSAGVLPNASSESVQDVVDELVTTQTLKMPDMIFQIKPTT